MPDWIADNFGTVLATVTALFLVITFFAARSVWRRARLLERRPGPVAAFAAAVVGLLGGLGGTYFFATGVFEVIPAEMAQRRLLDEAAPALAYTRVEDGTPSRLAEHRGKVVLVNLWATWCPPCREEMPDLERLQQDYRERGLVVLQISDEKVETIARYLESQPMSTEHGFLESFPWPQFSRPTTFLVDRDGVVRQAFSGARSFESFESKVARYL